MRNFQKKHNELSFIRINQYFKEQSDLDFTDCEGKVDICP